MTWCKDIERDAAVRAAEDGRTGPLPTLGECIDWMFPKSGSSSSAVDHENKGDGMATKRDQQAADYRAEESEREAPAGLRTRVTLEVTYDPHTQGHPKIWGWSTMCTCEGESVRVVEEAESDADSEMLRRSLVASEMRRLKVEAERDAAIRDRDESRQIAQTFESLCLGEQARNKVFKARVVELEAARITQALTADRFASAVQEADKLRARVAELEEQLESVACRAANAEMALQAASGGGEGEPDYYVYKNEVGMILYTSPKLVNDGWGGCTVERVYKAPPQPRGWLTESQSAAIKAMINLLKDRKEYPSGFTVYEDELDSLEDLLARSSPPEVVKPGTQVRYHSMSVEDQRDAQWIASLAAVGVAVKEVGK